MPLQRLDAVISLHCGLSRSQSQKLIRSGVVTVDGKIVLEPKEKLDPEQSVITANGREIDYKRFVYLMMNKPAGVLSASNDANAKTVVDLVPPQLSRRGLFPAGRLDKDTTGFVLLTDDGAFAHRLLSPGSHVMKTYLVTAAHVLSENDICLLESGVIVLDGKNILKSRVSHVSGNDYHITISEGKYHQIKRMLSAAGNEVLALKRIKIGGLCLDEALSPGDCRPITDEELALIFRTE